VFNRLLKPNTDLANRLPYRDHGLDAAAFHIGDMRIPDVKTMMMLYPVPAIWDNPSTLGCCTTPTSMRAFPVLPPRWVWARRLIST